jgi:hypothetical protein
MNDTNPNSQGSSEPKTKYDVLCGLINSSELSMLVAAITSNLCHVTDVFDAVRDKEADINTIKALFDLTNAHLYSMDWFIEAAIEQHNFVDFQICKKMINDLRLALLSTKVCTLNDNLKGYLFYGFYLNAKNLSDRINCLPDLVFINKGLLNE